MLMEPEGSQQDNKEKKKKERSNEEEEEEAARLLTEDPMDWVLKNEYVSNMMTDVRDRNLPNKLISMVSEMNNKPGDAECILLLLCKMKPFVWNMQAAVSEKIVGAESRQSNEKNAKDPMHVFFKYVPSREEFENNGVECEDTYTSCKLF